MRELLRELIRASGLVCRIGVNLNQAVARLNATGQRSGDLLPYAAASLRRANASTRWRTTSARRCSELRNVVPRAAEHSARLPVFLGSVPVIGKITAPRGERVEGLIYDLFGPGRAEEHNDPHIVAGCRIPPSSSRRCGLMAAGISGGCSGC